MGKQIIKQPDGKFAVFCSNTDTIVVWDGTQDEIIQWFVERAVESTTRQVEKLLGHVAADDPRKAYFQFAMTWDEALADDRAHGGDASRYFT